MPERDVEPPGEWTERTERGRRTRRNHVKRLLILAACAVGSACTPAELRAWQAWHADDPEAAIAFANLPATQDRLHKQPQPETTSSSVWDRLAECESGQRWDYNGGSGYDGGLQFAPSTWRAYGGQEYATYAWQATREQQIDIAERVLDDVGWGAWPTCSRKLGLR